ncbi:hypothetical protein G6F58_013349 [Rhizopus delemar]|nr:hypothetical protein G6F58_013349 [Rhizopus delemar]
MARPTAAARSVAALPATHRAGGMEAFLCPARDMRGRAESLAWRARRSAGSLSWVSRCRTTLPPPPACPRPGPAAG